jgi:hypothetical protein
LLLGPGLQAAAAAALALAVYLRTLAPTVMWYDMGEFASAAHVLGVAHNTGYPLLLLLGKLFTFLPVGEVAFRVNLLSAACGALTVGLAYLLVFEITRQRTPAAVAALSLAFSSTLWSNATWASSYNLNAALTTWALLVGLRWWRKPSAGYLPAAALLIGLGLGNHRLILVAVPALVSLVWAARRRSPAPGWRGLGRMAALFALGFSVNLYLPLRAAQSPPLNWGNPSTPERFLTMLTTGYARSFVNPLESLGGVEYKLRILAGFPAYEFSLAGLILAGLGAWALRRAHPHMLYASLLLMLFNALVISVYGIHNIFNYFQPIYLVLTLWLGAGAQRLLLAADAGARRPTVGRRAASPPPAEEGPSARAPARRRALAAGLLFALPLFLLARGFPLLDRSQHRDARDFAAYLLNRAEPGSVVLADFWSWAPLRYLQVVEGIGLQAEVSNALSVPGLDQQALLAELQRAGLTVYLAVGTPDSPRLRIGPHRLQLLAPNVIHYYPTWQVPLPRFKDLLLPRGSVLRALPTADLPAVDLIVAEVPPADRLSYRFSGGVELAGFHLDQPQLTVGRAFSASYFWRASQPTSIDYWVDLLFTDAEGNLAAREGLPIWLHSHWLGGGAFPTSDWPAGALVREQYDGLVPRSVVPGTYYLRAYLYEDDQRLRPAPLLESGRPELGALLAVVQVVAAGAP